MNLKELKEKVHAALVEKNLESIADFVQLSQVNENQIEFNIRLDKKIKSENTFDISDEEIVDKIVNKCITAYHQAKIKRQFDKLKTSVDVGEEAFLEALSPPAGLNPNQAAEYSYIAPIKIAEFFRNMPNISDLIESENEDQEEPKEKSYCRRISNENRDLNLETKENFSKELTNKLSNIQGTMNVKDIKNILVEMGFNVETKKHPTNNQILILNIKKHTTEAEQPLEMEAKIKINPAEKDLDNSKVTSSAKFIASSFLDLSKKSSQRKL